MKKGYDYVIVAAIIVWVLIISLPAMLLGMRMVM